MLKFHEAVIEEVTDALSSVFTGAYPDTLLQAPYVGPEYPILREKFPAIVLNFQESKLQTMGLGHEIVLVDDTGTTIHAQQWRFEGALNFEINALSTIDRAKVSDQLLAVLAFSPYDTRFKSFWTDITDSDFIALTLMNGALVSTYPSTTPAPWGDDNQLVYKSGYTMQVMGEFYSDNYTSDLIRISQVNLYPYASGKTPPAGTGDPNPWVT